MLLQLPDEAIEFFIGTQFRIEVRRVRDIIAVHASALRLQKRRCVKISNAQLVQVCNHVPCIVKTQMLVELQAIGRDGNPWSTHGSHYLAENVCKSHIITKKNPGRMPCA
jgi:hypothetical protein